jgi:hypothetical protein
MRKYALLVIAGLALAGPEIALAEVLTTEGIYPARKAGAVEVEEITIERFGGDVGEQLAIAITDRLDNVRLDSQPYFTIKSGTGGGNTYHIYGADGAAPGAASSGPVAATLRGTASGEVTEVRDGSEKRTRCVRRDDNKKCIEETVDVFRCRKMTVHFSPSLRLIAREGGTLYAVDDDLARSERYCANDESEPSPARMMDSMVDEFAQRVRYDLAPEFRREDVRIMESRKGLAKADSSVFKDAVQLTKSSQAASCAEFEAMLATYPDHASLLFNAGLCAERDGRLEEAAELYRRTLTKSDGQAYAQAGLGRVESRMRAERQLDRRYPPG